MQFNLEKALPTLLTAIVTMIGSFFVFKVDFKKTDNELLNINAVNFQRLYEYQNGQIQLLTKRVDSLALENHRLREEVTSLKIAYFKKTGYEISHAFNTP